MDTGSKPVKAILLDIEGTVCPISFVKETLYPYALQTLARDVCALWTEPSFAPYKQAFPEEHQASPDTFKDHVKDLVARDVKAPYLKQLQGYLWAEGYKSGELRAPLFPDVAPAMAAWHQKGIMIAIYSSGSVDAQKLFFAHTDGQPSDLTGLIAAWFDTVNAGPKTDAASYSAISEQFTHCNPSNWLFLSDNLAEVEASRASGMQSRPVMRPGNVPVPSHDGLAPDLIHDFGHGDLVGPCWLHPQRRETKALMFPSDTTLAE